MVFRGDARSPDQIRAAGGFALSEWPLTSSSRAFALYDHALRAGDAAATTIDSVYVSATSKYEQAVEDVTSLAKGGWVYVMCPLANMVDVAASLLHHDPHPERGELAAVAGIHWWQVLGSIFVPGRAEGAGPLQLKDLERKLVRNDDFDGDRCRFGDSEGQPQLAGFCGSDAVRVDEEPDVWSCARILSSPRPNENDAS
ncbi:putative enterotoxin [Cordyceps sp. RAO-2017]|nr:putative enterotoxin [Cordyceps sp. RAO-2017]